MDGLGSDAHANKLEPFQAGCRWLGSSRHPESSCRLCTAEQEWQYNVYEYIYMIRREYGVIDALDRDGPRK